MTLQMPRREIISASASGRPGRFRARCPIQAPRYRRTQLIHVQVHNPSPFRVIPGESQAEFLSARFIMGMENGEPITRVGEATHLSKAARVSAETALRKQNL